MPSESILKISKNNSLNKSTYLSSADPGMKQFEYLRPSSLPTSLYICYMTNASGLRNSQMRRLYTWELKN